VFALSHTSMIATNGGTNESSGTPRPDVVEERLLVFAEQLGRIAGTDPWGAECFYFVGDA